MISPTTPQLRFENHNNFTLVGLDWGDVQHSNIVAVLESVITEFYSVLDKNIIPKHSLFITPREDHPQFNKYEAYDVIGLSAREQLWGRYSYQFSHELCHFVILSDWFEQQSKFGWFEESMCEMASLFVLEKMSQTWETRPPYQNWAYYAGHFAEYINSTIDEYRIDPTQKLSEWISENIEDLEHGRYIRAKNIFVSLKLLPIFKENPDLWKTIQYLNLIDVDDEMVFIDFLTAWKNVLPLNLASIFILIEKTFL
jgi:hypothetical protein